jgi:hypothetical protein
LLNVCFVILLADPIVHRILVSIVGDLTLSIALAVIVVPLTAQISIMFWVSPRISLSIKGLSSKAL